MLPISNSLLIIDFIGQMFGDGSSKGCGLVAPGVQRTSVCVQLCLFFAMEGTNPLSRSPNVFTGKYGCCFKVQIRYFVLCFVNCSVLKKIRGHVWVLFSLQHLPPNPPMKRKMESSDTPISIPLHWWFSPPNENYSQNIPHEC